MSEYAELLERLRRDQDIPWTMRPLRLDAAAAIEALEEKLAAYERGDTLAKSAVVIERDKWMQAAISRQDAICKNCGAYVIFPLPGDEDIALASAPGKEG